MSQTMNFQVSGNLGNVEGAASDGVLIGVMTPVAASKGLLKEQKTRGMCITDDGGLYVDETTPWSEGTDDDVEVLPATPATDDAVYFGSSSKFNQIDFDLSTAGDGTWTITWEYWNGSAWSALAGVTDGSTGFTVADDVTVTFTVPSDWAKNTVDGNNMYWVRARVSAFTSVSTAPQIASGYLTSVEAAWVDDTTDLGDVGTGDVKLLPDVPTVGDGFYIGYTEKFCKVKITTSQARTGTATITWKYWNGTAWTALSVIEDDTAGWVTTAGALIVHFAPPSDWAANTAANGPNGEAGFFVAAELTALTSVTQQPLASIATVLPLGTGADGIDSPVTGSVKEVAMNAGTASATNADSKFILVNANTKNAVPFTWTKADVTDKDTVSLSVTRNDKLLIAQITEDGTTEFADANFTLQF